MTRGTCQPGLKTWRVVDPGLKTVGVFGPKNSTDGGKLHRFEGIILGIFFQYIQICLLLKSHHYRKVFSLIPANYRM